MIIKHLFRIIMLILGAGLTFYDISTDINLAYIYYRKGLCSRALTSNTLRPLWETLYVARDLGICFGISDPTICEKDEFRGYSHATAEKCIAMVYIVNVALVT